MAKGLVTSISLPVLAGVSVLYATGILVATAAFAGRATLSVKEIDMAASKAVDGGVLGLTVAMVIQAVEAKVLKKGYNKRVSKFMLRVYRIKITYFTTSFRKEISFERNVGKFSSKIWNSFKTLLSRN